MDNPQFGKVTSNVYVDENTTAQRTRSFKEYEMVDDRVRYEERTKVKDLDEAAAKVAELADKVANDIGLIDPAWRYEGRAWVKSRGYFYIVFSYTKVLI